MDEITSRERSDLQAHLRQRCRVQKSMAKERSAKLLAEFEDAMAARFHYDDDETWKEAQELAQREVDKAEARVAARCAELGIPKQFAPSLSLHWYSRGESACKHRRAELRKVAATRIEAIEKEAITRIDVETLEASTELLKTGITSDVARGFLERLTPVEQLMKALSFDEIAGPAEPSVVEQILTPNALRQRRYRDKQRALRDGNNVMQLPPKGAA